MSKKAIGIVLGILVLGLGGVYAYSGYYNKQTSDAVDSYLQDLNGKNTEQPTNAAATPTPAVSVTPSVPAQATAFSGSVALTSQNTKLAWIGRKTLVAGYEDAGKIDISSGNVLYKDGKIVSANAVLNMASIETLTTGKGDGQDKLSGHLKSPDFFDVEKYPTGELNISSAKLVSESSGKQTYEFSGNLTLKGLTKPVVFSGTVVQSGQTAVFTAETKLDRTLWGITYASSKVADGFIDDLFTVKISSNVELK